MTDWEVFVSILATILLAATCLGGLSAGHRWMDYQHQLSMAEQGMCATKIVGSRKVYFRPCETVEER